jgi:hypothetical protein
MQAKVYQLRRGTRFGFIFTTLVGTLLAIMGVGCLFECLLSTSPERWPACLVFLLPGLILAVLSVSVIVRGRLVLDQHQITATCVVTNRIRLTDIARLGLYRVPTYNFVQELALGGEGSVLWIKDQAGNTTKVDVYRYGNSDDFLQLLHEQVQLEYETIKSGWLGASWPS